VLETAPAVRPTRYERFTLSDRIEHWVQVVAFTGLAITGLVQFAADAAFPRSIISALGGINNTRFIHRSFGVVVLLAMAYHFGTAGYRFYVERIGHEIVPGRRDVRAAVHSALFSLGRRSDRPLEGKFTFSEKIEYWSIIWGTVLMAITGLMMWNPVATTKILPGQFIPAAKAAHGGEAILAVLAILIWHTYFIHIRHFNRSMFHGHLTENEMRRDHPAELSAIHGGGARREIAPEELRRRRSRFFAFYVVVVLVGAVSVIGFLTYEEIAIKTVPPDLQSEQVSAPSGPAEGVGSVDAAIRVVSP